MEISMRAATTRTGSRSRRWIAVVGAAIGSVLLTALVAAPAYADATPNVDGKARTSTTTVATQQGGPRWVQTDPVAFSHDLTGADRAYEQVSEVGALTIPFPGVWEVSYTARTYIGLPTSTSSQYVHTALFNNGALIPGSEALTGIYGSGAAGQYTAGQTFMHTFAAGDVVTLYAYRIGQNSAHILSNGDGRTGVMRSKGLCSHWCFGPCI
jgi:hypothetical protein